MLAVTAKAGDIRVSVVMAAYNAEDYIEKAILSVLSQTFEGIEVVIVNDGSSDGTLKKIEELCRCDSRVRIISQKNSGQTTAKNQGIINSLGEFVAFCDADDYYAVDKLEKQLSIFDADASIGVVYSDTQSIDESGVLLEESGDKSFFEGDVLNDLLFDNFIPFGSAMVRRQCLEEHGAFNEEYRMGIDWDLWLRISTRWKFSYIDEKLYFYRQWAGQMSRNYDGRYTGARLILKNFYAKHKGLVGFHQYRRAQADIYAGHAYHISLYEGYVPRLFWVSIMAVVMGVDYPSSLRRVARALVRSF